MADDRFDACYVTTVETKLKYNFSGSVYLLQGVNITGMSTKWFQRFESLRVNFSNLRISSSLWEFRIREGSRNWR